MTSPQLIITTLYFCSALGSLVFLIRYATMRWWKTQAGRLVMGLHFVMVGFGVSSMLVLFHGLNYTGRIYLSIALLLLLNIVMWGFSVELHRAQKEAAVKKTMPVG